MGGGHYTAYAQNFATKKWYEFDDSRVMPLAETKEVVSSAAYNLFYRLRDHVEDLEHLDFESIRQQVDPQFLESIRKHEQTKKR